MKMYNWFGEVNPSLSSYLLIYLLGWSGTKSTVTAAICWPTVPGLDDKYY
jgi:hypothetical protein